MLSHLKELIIVFYDLKRKLIISYGTSQIGFHSVCANIHAEEIALKKAKKYLIINKLKRDYFKNIKIMIWKGKEINKIRPAYTCSWCAGLIRYFKFPKENIITIGCVNAYKDDYKQPLKKSDL